MSAALGIGPDDCGECGVSRRQHSEARQGHAWREARVYPAPTPIGKPRKALSPVLLSSVDASAPAPMLLDRLDPGEHTILFGPGAVGKGALAASWITRLTNAGTPVVILDYEDHAGEWARRIGGLGGDMDQVAYVSPLRDGAGPIWDHADQIAAMVAANPGTYVVIDSAVMACAGADPMDPATPTRFYAALQQIGAPSLTLAHVNRLHDVRYPFGSVFWHNLARVTWSLMPKGEDVLLTCQKASNYLKPSAATVEMTWMDGLLREVWEKRASVVLLDRICEVLEDGPLATSAIAGALNTGLPKDEQVSVDTIRRTLNREASRRGARVSRSGDQWSLTE